MKLGRRERTGFVVELALTGLIVAAMTAAMLAMSGQAP